MTIFWILVVALASGEAFGGDPIRKTLRNGSHTAELSVNDGGKITVQVKRDSDDVPQSILLTIYDKNRRPTVLELKALSPPSADTRVSTYTGSSSSLSLGQQSSIGFEVTIPLSKGSKEPLHLKAE